MNLRTAKIIIIVAVLLGFFVLPRGTISFAAGFPDVPPSHPHSLAIQTLKDENLLSGYGDGTFQPDQSISRAETVAMILKSAGITPQKSATKLPFSDVPEDAWFYPMIQTAVSFGKVKGYEDKTFRPHQPVTLPEAITFMLSFFNQETKKVPLDVTIYGGLDRLAWYAKRMQYAKNYNLIEPDENGFIDPQAAITRGQMAQLLYRMRMVHQTGKPFDITKEWIETEHSQNFWKIKYPKDWEVFKGLKNSVIWKRDTGVGPTVHSFFARVWPSSARLSISLIENSENLTAMEYFAKLKKAYQTSYPEYPLEIRDTSIADRPTLKVAILGRHIIDMAMNLPNKNFLLMQGEYGEAPKGEFLKKHLETMMMSYQFIQKPPQPLTPLSERLETLRENILVAGKLKETLSLFPDKKLIYTDGIGIGTGPIDYHYSKEANHTIKGERNSGTILNIREGETTKF